MAQLEQECQATRRSTDMYCSKMDTLENDIDRIAMETGFSGVVRVDRGDSIEIAKAYGMAHRGLQIANTIDTQFGIASGVKGMTALAVVSLIVDDVLDAVNPRPRRPRTRPAADRRCRDRRAAVVAPIRNR